MGISPSKRASTILTNSPSFTAACDAVYNHCLELTQHAFPGILPYQLNTASHLLHSALLPTHPLISRWLKSPPTRSQVDSAARRLLKNCDGDGEEEIVLELDEFRAFSVDLFTDAVVASVRMEVLKRLPIGVGGIVGVGVLTRSRNDLVGTAVGVYALGVATSVYLGISAGSIQD